MPEVVTGIYLSLVLFFLRFMFPRASLSKSFADEADFNTVVRLISLTSSREITDCFAPLISTGGLAAISTGGLVADSPTHASLVAYIPGRVDRTQVI